MTFPGAGVAASLLSSADDRWPRVLAEGSTYTPLLVALLPAGTLLLLLAVGLLSEA
jgi:hypothetical protein